MKRWLCGLFAALLVCPLFAQGVSPNPQYTAPEGQPLAGWRICVDPGHGGQVWGRTRGYTGGTRSAVSDTTESDVNLRVGMFLWDLLTQAGAEVVMTRTHETRLSEDCFSPPGSDDFNANRSEELGIRCRVAEANDCDLMISIHHNAVNNAEVNFTTAFYFDPLAYRTAEGQDPPVEHPAEAVDLSRRLAESLVVSLHERLDLPTRPARHGDYHVLRETSLPVVLTEGSFMTNPDEARRLDDLARTRLEAIAIFEGVMSCLVDENGAAGGDE